MGFVRMVPEYTGRGSLMKLLYNGLWGESTKKSIIEEKRIERNRRKRYETGREAGGDPCTDPDVDRRSGDGGAGIVPDLY